MAYPRDFSGAAGVRPDHIANDRLPAFTDRDMLHRDFLLAAGPVALERLHLHCEGPRQLVECSLGAVLLRYGLDAASRFANVIVARWTAAIWAASIASR